MPNTAERFRFVRPLSCELLPSGVGCIASDFPTWQLPNSAFDSCFIQRHRKGQNFHHFTTFVESKSSLPTSLINRKISEEKARANLIGLSHVQP